MREVTVQHKNPRQLIAIQQWNRCLGGCMILTGPAGTGKTHIAWALSLADMISSQQRRLYISRPQVPCDGEKMGFLPGDMARKFLPWLEAFSDVSQRCSFIKFDQIIQKTKLMPIGMVRGRTIERGTLFVDEAQNLSMEALKAILTRVGDTGRIVLAGDPAQSDRFPANDCPLSHVADKIAHFPDVCRVEFKPEDQQRSDFVRRVLEVL